MDEPPTRTTAMSDLEDFVQKPTPTGAEVIEEVDARDLRQLVMKLRGQRATHGLRSLGWAIAALMIVLLGMARGAEFLPFLIAPLLLAWLELRKFLAAQGELKALAAAGTTDGVDQGEPPRELLSKTEEGSV